MDPRCAVFLVVAKTEHPKSRHESHTIVLVPRAARGVVLERALTVFGYDDAPYGHAQVLLDNVVVPKTNIIKGKGTGFMISQARLGPGRIHHCMRAIGMGAFLWKT
jgi:acyl-CoA dehydrogenase